MANWVWLKVILNISDNFLVVEQVSLCLPKNVRMFRAVWERSVLDSLFRRVYDRVFRYTYNEHSRASDMVAHSGVGAIANCRAKCSAFLDKARMATEPPNRARKNS